MADKDSDKDHKKADKEQSKQDLKKSSSAKEAKQQSAKPKSRKTSPDWVSTKSKVQHSNKPDSDTKETKKDSSFADKCYTMANSLIDNAKIFFTGKESAHHEGTVKKSPQKKSPAPKSPALKSPSKSSSSPVSGRKHCKSPDGCHGKHKGPGHNDKKKHRKHSSNDDIFEINVTQFKQAHSNTVTKQHISPLPQMMPTGKWTHSQCDGLKRKNSKDGPHDEHNQTADKNKQKPLTSARSTNQKGSKSQTSLSPGKKSAGTAKKPKTKSPDETAKPTKAKSADKLKPKSKTAIRSSKAKVVHKKTDAKAHDTKPGSPDSKNKKSPTGQESNDTKKKKGN